MTDPRPKSLRSYYSTHFTLHLAQKLLIDTLLKPNKNIKDKVWAQVLISKSTTNRVVCLLVCLSVCAPTRASAYVCLFWGRWAMRTCVLAVRGLVVVFVLLGQRRPGLLHFLSFLSAAAAFTDGRINHHTELLAQVRHLIWKKRATRSFRTGAVTGFKMTYDPIYVYCTKTKRFLVGYIAFGLINRLINCQD